MTETLSPVVVPYAEFLERRDRRRRLAAELKEHEAHRTIDGEAVALPVEKPVSSEPPDGSESPRPARQAERAT